MDSGPRLPRIAVAYIGVVVAGAVALALSYLVSPGSGWPHPSASPLELVAAGILFAVAAFFAEIFPIKVPSSRIFDDHGDTIAISSSAYIASLLLFGPAFTVLVTAASILCSELWKRKAPLKIAFNVGQYVLTVGVSGLFLLRTGTDPHSFDLFVRSPEAVMALLATLMTYFLLNTTLVSGILALVRGSSFLDVWKQNNREILPQYVGMLNVGIVAAVLWTASPAAIVLLALPLLVLQVAFRATAQLREETMRALVGIAEMVDARDSYAYHHSVEVARYSTEMATRLGLSLEDVETVNLSALLHDIGKIGTPDRILQKPDSLTVDELAIMKLHPAEGAKVLQYFSLFRPGVDLVQFHQEHYDGTGYPKGLSGEKIPLGARIIHVADAYQAMTSDRVYRKGVDPNTAVNRLLAGAGTQFDPRVVAALVEVLRDSGAQLDGPLAGEWRPVGVPSHEEQKDVLGISGTDRPDPGPSFA